MIIKSIKKIPNEFKSIFYTFINAYPDSGLGIKLRRYYWRKGNQYHQTEKSHLIHQKGQKEKG